MNTNELVDTQKLLRVLMGSCSTVAWMTISGQCSPEQAVEQIRITVLKVAEEMGIDINAQSQLECLRDEAVEFMSK